MPGGISWFQLESKRVKEEREAQARKFSLGQVKDKRWFKKGPSREDFEKIAELGRQQRAQGTQVGI
jgi:hypothetical protein